MKKKPAILVHGGAGLWEEDLDRLAAGKVACREAAKAGQAVLLDGGSALDAVEVAVRVMEDSPALDAGRGSHLNARGEARMVDVSDKAVTARTATAEGIVTMAPATLDMILDGTAPKGDVLATARIAGIMGAKKTSELIPLCHPLALSKVTVAFAPDRENARLRVEATVMVDGKTGVEMEALTAVTVACLTLYDMCKAVDRAMSFSGIRLIEKTGGRSGTFRAP